MEQQISIFSFFSGAGFLDLGFELSGFEVVRASELFPPFANAYEYARGRMGIKAPRYGLNREDVNAVLNDSTLQNSILSEMEQEKSQRHLTAFIGGPPCPDFSVGGKNKGVKGERGVLSQVYADLICKCQPDLFLFENVKGLWRTAKHRVFFESMLKQFAKADYVTTYALLNALSFGVPQDRDRIMIFGVRKALLPDRFSFKKDFWHPASWKDPETLKSLPWPSSTNFSEGSNLPQPPGIDESLTVKHWFDLNQVESHPNAHNHFRPKAAAPKMLAIAEGDDSRKSSKRLHRWRFSPTAAYGNNEVHWHPWLNRRLSAAEALAVQSLPAQFELPQSMTLSNMFKTIGNGVPFLLAKAVAEQIASFCKKEIRNG